MDELITIKPVFGPKPDKESHKLKLEIDVDPESGLWYTKFTCPLCPEYIQLHWSDKVTPEGLRIPAKDLGKKNKLKTVPEIHHWFNGMYTKHLEKN